MKVTNLTDVKSKEQVRRGLEDQTFSVADTLIEPGASVVFAPEQERLVIQQTRHLVAVKALSLDEVPAWYTKEKGVPAPPPTVPARMNRKARRA